MHTLSRKIPEKKLDESEKDRIRLSRCFLLVISINILMCVGSTTSQDAPEQEDSFEGNLKYLKGSTDRKPQE